MKFLFRSKTNKSRFIRSVFIGYLSCLIFYAYSAFLDKSLEYDYLIYNLFLASLPLIISALIVRLLKTRLWTNWLMIILSIIFLAVLPNSYYMVTDLIHIDTMSFANLVFNVLTFTSFSIMAFFIGVVSLMLIHLELRKRLYPKTVHMLLLLIILLNGVAIYIGRNLRWNSWDILLHPSAILVEISTIVFNLFYHLNFISTVLGFSLLIGSVYYICWQIYRLIWRKGVDEMVEHLKNTKKYEG